MSLNEGSCLCRGVSVIMSLSNDWTGKERSLSCCGISVILYKGLLLSSVIRGIERDGFLLSKVLSNYEGCSIYRVILVWVYLKIRFTSLNHFSTSHVLNLFLWEILNDGQSSSLSFTKIVNIGSFTLNQVH